MKKQERKVFIAIALMAAFLSLAAGIVTAVMAVQHMKNAFGAVYEADPEAARLISGVLLSGEEGNGDEAAAALGLTSRFFVFLNGRLFGGLWPALLLLLSLLPLLAVCLYLRREKAYLEMLKQRTERTLAGETVFYSENEEERLIGKILSDYEILREKTAEQLTEQRMQTENIAHELKTPVSSLLLTLDLAERDGLTPERSKRMRDSAEQMQRYIGNLLMLARLRAGRVRIVRETVDLGEMMEEMAAEMPETEVSVAGDAIIMGDRERLKEAFRNLIANALRYSEDGGCRIVFAEEEEMLRVQVINRGEGQPALERYAAGREDGTSSGLGTAIAAEIIRAHFGSLIVSAADGLTMVTVMFPRDKLKNKERV